MMQAVEVSQLYKSFVKTQSALNDINLSVAPGEMVALIGASGSGKSTLLRHIAGLVPADTGSQSRVTVFGREMQCNGRIARDAREIRCGVGVIFQQFNLVPRLRVLSNVLIGYLGKMDALRGLLGHFSGAQKVSAMQALARVGIVDKALHRGSELSGGQQQRAAIARALVQQANLVVADEPIASLDPSAARRVMDILHALNRDDGITVLVSLHQVEYALAYCPRTIALRAGEIVYDGPTHRLTAEFLAELYGDESKDLLLPSLISAQDKTSTLSSGSGGVRREIAICTESLQST